MFVYQNIPIIVGIPILMGILDPITWEYNRHIQMSGVSFYDGLCAVMADYEAQKHNLLCADK